ncbi:hypothetical protein KEM44_20890 [Sinorhizobium meliloti]|uniref:hypothetical protein n=1 Tax=Rhizobium meliloti TaxID=382 RepID=UPI000B5AA0DE|nr:hypothetical protein [Sinorhizobium meliloti]ASJ58945.1 hypothetical protein SMB554_06935 [Sinorhizobium meliloti]MCK3783528.1 hypothetical protein [Sinorhizobium meliloti]MCK3787842.1 hypothetical protein [Sinorhizobium meliloti]MCK3794881.1 hypothetical protein [Sinorhizobium meliloti]UTG98587.1 hypothetical protein KEM44_20890 [Sinorhizobium meliloti]
MTSIPHIQPRPRFLTLEVNGRKFIYAALVNKDPMEMTLAEWRKAPTLTALVLLQQTMKDRRP